MSQTLTLNDLIKQNPTDPRSWVVDGLLRTHTKRPSCILGYPEAGKSTLAAQLAICVSKGQPFLGRQTLESKVIYWKFEDSQIDTKDSFVRAGAANDNLIFVFPEQGDNNFKELAKTLKAHPTVRLVVIETMADFFRLDDVTNNDEERRCLEKFSTQITEKFPDCVFVLLHHFNKTDLSVDSSKLSISKILGGTAFAAGTSTKIYLQQVSDADPRRVILATTRDGKGTRLEPTYLTYDPETSTCTLGISVREGAQRERHAAKAQKETNLVDRIRKALSENPGIPKMTLATLVGGKRITASDTIDQLIFQGSIRAELGGATGSARLLYLNETLPMEGGTQ